MCRIVKKKNKVLKKYSNNKKKKMELFGKKYRKFYPYFITWLPSLLIDLLNGLLRYCGYIE